MSIPDKISDSKQLNHNKRDAENAAGPDFKSDNSDFFVYQSSCQGPEPSCLPRIDVPQESQQRVSVNKDALGHGNNKPIVEDVIKTLPLILTGLVHMDQMDQPAGGAVIQDTKSTKRESLSYEKLQGIVEKSFSDLKEKQLLNDKLAGLNQRAGKEGLTQQDLEHFYYQLGRVCLESQHGNERFTPGEMKQLALDMATHGGKAGTVHQGGYPTCVLGAPESVIFGADPAAAAAVVADVAINGQIVLTDGTTVKPPNNSLHEDKYRPGKDQSKRSLADRIFQVTLANVYWNGRGNPPGDHNLDRYDKLRKIFYEEGHPHEFIDDPGCRLMDYSVNPPRPFTEKVTITDITELIPNPKQIPRDKSQNYSREEPRTDNEVPIGSLPALSRLIGAREITVVDKGARSPAHSPQSFDEFKKLLTDAKAGRNGLRLPLVLGIDVSQGPLAKDHKIDSQPGRGDNGHALAVFDYDPATELVGLQNQLADSLDHMGEPGGQSKLPVNIVYEDYERATRPIDGGNRSKIHKPEEYIQGQKSFIDLLQSDSRVKPEKIFQEKLLLHHYLDHLQFHNPAYKDEANKLLTELSGDYSRFVQDVSKSKTADTLGLSRTLLERLSKDHRDKEIKNVLASLDGAYKSVLAQQIKEPSGLPDADTFEACRQLVNLHADFGDKQGASKLHKELTSVVDAKYKSILLDQTKDPNKDPDYDIVRAYSEIAASHAWLGDEQQVVNFHRELMSLPIDSHTKTRLTEIASDMSAKIPNLSKIRDMRNDFEKDILASVFRDPAQARNDIGAYMQVISHSLNDDVKKEDIEKLISDMVSGIAKLQPRSDDERTNILAAATESFQLLGVYKFTDQVAKNFDWLLAQQRSLQDKLGKNSPEALNSKVGLVHVSRRIDRKEVTDKLIGELEQYCAETVADIKNPDDSNPLLEKTSESLKLIYQVLDKSDQMYRVVNDQLKRIENGKDSSGHRRGAEHRDLLDPLTRLGETFFSMGRYEQSKEMFERAKAICKKNGKPFDSRHAAFLEDVYLKLRKPAKGRK